MIDRFREQYFFLSNFYPCQITYNGILFENAEAAFQAQKCIDPQDRLRFASLNASEAKRLGRSIALRPDWEQVKVEKMQQIIHAKFAQNPDLKKSLLNTENEYLVEGNTWGDRVWGVVNGQGANLLGRILMQERNALRRSVC